MGKSKGCELCSNKAKIYCDSDQARLCWGCDEKVHGANFLVAKHCRSLLCHICQSPTPWKASGAKLGHTISVCENCYVGCSSNSEIREEEEEQDENDVVLEVDSEDDDGEYTSSYEEEMEDEEDDGENQVVPWSPCWSSTPAVATLAVASSSCSEEAVGDGGATVSSSFKRMRQATNLDSDEEDGCSSQFNNNNGDSAQSISSSLRPLKMARTAIDFVQKKRGEIMDSKRRRQDFVRAIIKFRQNIVAEEHSAASIVQGITNLSKDE